MVPATPGVAVDDTRSRVEQRPTSPATTTATATAVPLTAAEMTGGAAAEMMSMANYGKGFMMLQPDQKIKSLVIEIGLDDTVMQPLEHQHLIGIEASLKSICELRAASAVQASPRTTLLAAAMGSRVGVTDWYERAGWTAANSMSAQPNLPLALGSSKSVTLHSTPRAPR